MDKSPAIQMQTARELAQQWLSASAWVAGPADHPEWYIALTLEFIDALQAVVDGAE